MNQRWLESFIILGIIKQPSVPNKHVLTEAVFRNIRDFVFSRMQFVPQKYLGESRKTSQKLSRSYFISNQNLLRTERLLLVLLRFVIILL